MKILTRALSLHYLREYEEFSYKEISEALQLTVDQVKITLHRARKRLATIADKEGWQYDRME
ncbi:sigma factor-like helix-turn-helix DNA-binding protein [Sporosarcina sp. USHLN248]|uniref:sigma factor-like helix-turn-helix DNA-binding protein n=1 Tax=Sporosarcina sp. USHLN248 TaxID=3081300 RepID=UPI00301A72D7